MLPRYESATRMSIPGFLKPLLRGWLAPSPGTVGSGSGFAASISFFVQVRDDALSGERIVPLLAEALFGAPFFALFFVLSLAFVVHLLGVTTIPLLVP